VFEVGWILHQDASKCLSPPSIISLMGFKNLTLEKFYCLFIPIPWVIKKLQTEKLREYVLLEFEIIITIPR